MRPRSSNCQQMQICQYEHHMKSCRLISSVFVSCLMITEKSFYNTENTLDLIANREFLSLLPLDLSL